MKKHTKIYLLNLLLIVLFGAATVSFYLVHLQFSEIVKQESLPFVITIPLLPLLLFILLGGYIAFLLFRVAEKNNRKAVGIRSLLIPVAFLEDDEREQMITARACRSSYISMWYTFPIIVGLMFVYPFINESVPYFPLAVILLLPVVQLTVFYITVRRILTGKAEG